MSRHDGYPSQKLGFNTALQPFGFEVTEVDILIDPACDLCVNDGLFNVLLTQAAARTEEVPHSV